MEYIKAGYYVMVHRPLSFGSCQAKIVRTASTCINESLLDHWCYSWTTDNNGYIEEVKERYIIDEDNINAIRAWADKALDDRRIGWINVFKDRDAAEEYVGRFFSHLPDVHIYGLCFAAAEADALLEAFRPFEENMAHLGLYVNLNERIREEHDSDEMLVGFDVIGVELDGGFHSFHCHDLASGLVEKLGLRLNVDGLFEDTADWGAVSKYMNDPENGYEPVPWFPVKVKMLRR